MRRTIVLAQQQTPQGLAASKAALDQLRPRLQAVREHSAELQGWEAMADSAQTIFSTRSPLPALALLGSAIQRGNKTPGFDPALLYSMQLRLSSIYLKANQPQQALDAARNAMRTIVAQEGADSPSLTSGRLFTEEALFYLQRYREVLSASEQDYRRFLAIYGAASQYTLSTQDMHAQAESALEHYSYSTRDWLAMYEASHGDKSLQYFAETAIVQAGQTECHRAAYAEGENYLTKGLSEIAVQGGPKAFNYSIGSLALAECLLAQQEDGQSAVSPAGLAHIRQLLSQIDLGVLGTFAGTQSAQGNLYLAQARLAYLEGQLEKARQLAGQAHPLLTQAGADPWEVDRLDRLEKALSSHRS